jgi:hypothetical protein
MRLQRLFLLSVVVLAVGGCTSDGGESSEADAVVPPTPAYMDGSLSRDDVIASIQEDFCSQISRSENPLGFSTVACVPHDARGEIVFSVFDSTDKRDQYLDLTTCNSSAGLKFVSGPTWVAHTLYSDVAGLLIDNGADMLFCS